MALTMAMKADLDQSYTSLKLPCLFDAIRDAPDATNSHAVAISLKCMSRSSSRLVRTFMRSRRHCVRDADATPRRLAAAAATTSIPGPARVPCQVRAQGRGPRQHARRTSCPDIRVGWRHPPRGDTPLHRGCESAHRDWQMCSPSARSAPAADRERAHRVEAGPARLGAPEGAPENQERPIGPQKHEDPTSRSAVRDRRSNRPKAVWISAPERIRTSDLRFRRPTR
jgi:hypothetical protein